jgi:Sulfotransferase family
MEDRGFRVAVATDAARLQPVGERPLIFHGINKSGSLVLTNVLRQAYFRAGRAHQVFSHYHATPSDLGTLADIAEHTRGHAFFVGHYLFGALDPKRHAFVTVLRHPLPRVVSCYSWLQRKHLRQRGAPARVPGWRERYRSWLGRDESVVKGAPLAADGSFPTLAEYARTSFRNHSQVSQFAPGFAPKRGTRLKHMRPADQLEAAKEAIERDIRCIGISEYFEETIFLFAHLCGLEEVAPWQRDERNAERPLVDSLPPADLAAIREGYAPDFELYDFALARFRAQLDVARLQGDIDAYRAAGAGQYKDRILTPAEGALAGA